ncbi:MAG: metallophosphoesterase family protein [Anaerolineae bacterium]|nr:metallophosphoesterase family protein [Anaerolineae bacterium]
MRIGLIADVHANLHALEQVLKTLDEQNVNLILCAGDLVCYGAHPNEVVRLLYERQVSCVAGNYDDAVAWNQPTASRKPSSPANEPLKRAALVWTQHQVTASTIQYLADLPWMVRHWVGGISVCVLHAGLDYLDEWISPDDLSGFDDLAKLLSADVVVLGHTHRAYAFEHQGTFFINPGAVGRSLDGDVRAAYAILDTQEELVTFGRVAYDIEAATQAIAASDMPDEIAELVRCGARRIEEVNSPQSTVYSS